MNPLKAYVYQVEDRIYRRNVPVEQCIMGGLASQARFCAEGEEEVIECGVNIGANHDYSTLEDSESIVATSSTMPVRDEPLDAKTRVPISYNTVKKCWHTEIHVPPQLLGRVIGSRGAVARRLEETTNCKIVFPSKGRDVPIEIISHHSAESVERCYDSIELIVIDARKKMRFTHFIMFPLCLDETFRERYRKFQDNVRGLDNIPDDLNSIFMAPEKIHFTIVPLWLFSSEDEKKARDCLKRIVREKLRLILNDQKLKIQVKGLRHFGDEDPSNARVVWAKSDCTKLQEMAQIIADEMRKTGLTSERREKVTLHMTVINTTYSKERRNWRKTKKRKLVISQESEEIIQEVGQITAQIKKSRFIDATNILENFKDHDFGEIEIDQVRICQIGGTDDYTKGYPTIFMHQFLE